MAKNNFKNKYKKKFKKGIEPIIACSGVGVIIFFLWSMCHWEHAPTNATYSSSLIRVSFELPVLGFSKVAPVLFPTVILVGASFGMRKLFRVGYDVSDRLKKVEDK